MNNRIISQTTMQAGFSFPHRSNADWRFEQPVWDQSKCTRCGACHTFCPDAAVKENSAGYYEPVSTYCKGCGICSRQCPVDCITMKTALDRPLWLIKL